MEALLLTPSLLLAFLLWQANRRYDTREEKFDDERSEWTAERGSLLNRIQAPEVEVAKQFEVTEPAYLEWDNDADFNRYREALDERG